MDHLGLKGPVLLTDRQFHPSYNITTGLLVSIEKTMDLVRFVNDSLLISPWPYFKPI